METPTPGRWTSAGPPRRLTSVFVAFFVGTIMLQAAWSMATRPFHGADERANAFRASAVAHGDIVPGSDDLQWVDASLVRAYEPMCPWVQHPLVDGGPCPSVPADVHGTALVPTTASRYDPLYYVIPGLLSRPFDGLVQLYVMRIVTSLISALFVSLAAVAIFLWARTRWPAIALVASLSPEVVFSGAYVNADGVEMAAAILTWSAALGLVRPTGQERTLLRLLAIGAVPLAIIRTLGPFWVTAALISFVIVAGVHRAKSLLTLPEGRVVLALTGLATTIGLAWSASVGANMPYDLAGAPFGSPWPEMLSRVRRWTLHQAGLFPAQQRSDPAFYLVEFTVLAIPLLASLRRSPVRHLLVQALLVSGCASMSVGASAVLYPHLGDAWQGKYVIPASVGILLTAGLAADTRPPGLRTDRVMALVLALSVVAEALGQTALMAQWRGTPYALPMAQWGPLIAALIVAGIAAWGVPCLLRRSATTDERPSSARLPK